MESYLRRCLDSVCIDGVIDRIEIITVNDGSADSSLSIMETYKEQYPHSVIIINKPNGHYGSCVNAALQRASGKYFRPLDADDWFDAAAFVHYVDVLQEIDVDMVLTNFSREYGGTSRVFYSKKDRQCLIPGQICDMRGYCFGNTEKILRMHGMTYRTELLKSINFKCSEGISYTDTEYCFYPLGAAVTFIYINIVLYKYYIGRGEQSVSLQSAIKNRNHRYIILIRIIEYLCSANGNTINREKQLSILKRLLAEYYLIILCYSGRTITDDRNMKNLDAAIKNMDWSLYSLLGKCCFLGIHYVRLWRGKDIYCVELNSFRFIYTLYEAARYIYKRSIDFICQKIISR
jgi:glycosyltransferase involved in cell wall biosynthesis